MATNLPAVDMSTPTDDAVVMHRSPFPPTTVALMIDRVELLQAPATLNDVPRHVAVLDPMYVTVVVVIDEATRNVLPAAAEFVITEPPSTTMFMLERAPPK